MTGAYWMNAGALALGLAAWGLGLAALFPQRRESALLCGGGSFAACSASLSLELFYQAHLANIEDVSAFLDTADAVAMCAGVLLAGTLALNAAALLLRLRRRKG